PDSKHVFFTLHTMKGTSKGQTYNQLVWDGQVSSIQTTNLEVALNADGEHYAYVAYNPMNESQSIIVLDGKTAGYTGSKLMFTPSGQHLFATAPPVAGRTGQEILVDGKPWV